MTPITDRQREILDFIVQCQRQGYTPTVREICSEFSVSSPNGIVSLLNPLEKKGYIRRNDKLKARMIEVIDTGRAETLWGSFPI